MEHTTEYGIDKRSVYDIINQIYKDNALYPYVKEHKSKRDGRGASYAFHSRWLSPNHVNPTASEVKMLLQMSTYDGKKKKCNWESMLPHMSRGHIILKNLIECGYQDLHLRLNI